MFNLNFTSCQNVTFSLIICQKIQSANNIEGELDFKMGKHIYSGVDILKLFAAIGVVAIHSGAVIANSIGRLGVPFFAITSSILFFKKYCNLADIRVKREYLHHYLKRLLCLYLLWQIIYMPLVIVKIKDYYYLKDPWIVKWSIFVWRFIFPGYGYTHSGHFIAGTNGWGVSWYLTGMLMGLPILCWAIEHINHYIIGVVCLGLEIGFICSSGYLFITNFYIWGILTFLRLFVYLFIGYAISHNLSKLQSISLILVIISSLLMLLLFLIENVIIYKLSGNIASEELITTVPTSSIITILAFKVNLSSRYTIFIRNYSTFLYTSQIAYLIILSEFTIFPGIINGYFKLVMTVVLSFFSFLVYLFIRKRTKWAWLYYMV